MYRLTLICLVFLSFCATLYADDSENTAAFQQSTAGGDAKAQYELAFLYEEEAMADGDIFEPALIPWEKAMHWYEAAAAQGHKQAQYALLSRMYLYPNDKRMDAKWLELARTMTEGGDKFAQYRLARHFMAICIGGRKLKDDPCLEAIHWHAELLKGTEKKSGSEDILPRHLTLSKNATIRNIRDNLKYLKELAQ